MRLSLKVLGGFSVRDGSGAECSLPTKKTRALLGYLAANADKPQERESLVGLLWSNFDDKRARHSLNQALVAIRKLSAEVGAPLLAGQGEQVTLLGGALAIDLADFRKRLVDDPAGAAALYDGPFLDGFAISEPAFDDWLMAERSEIHELACKALGQAADVADESGDMIAATATVRRLLALDPLNERAHRRLMAMLYKAEDRTAALRQYQVCAELLDRELNVEPEPATKALYASIKGSTGTNTEAVHVASVMEGSATRSVLSSEEKPSIAVLPFVNMSGDPNQIYLVDGIHLSIYATLIKVSGLFLIGGANVSNYRQREYSAEQASRELRVRYLLEGAVQVAGQRLRVTVHLNDTLRHRVVWAEQYDRVLDDIFALQDEIALEVLAELDIKLISGEGMRVYRNTLKNPIARDCYYRALSHFYSNTKVDNSAARSLFERVVELQPDSPEGPSFVCFTYWLDVFRGWSDNVDESMAFAVRWAKKASNFENNNGIAYVVLAADNLFKRRFDEALSTCSKAYDYRPNCPAASGYLANILHYCGESGEAIVRANEAIRLLPKSPPWFTNVLAAAYREDGQIESSIAAATETLKRNSDDIEARTILCSDHVLAGTLNNARQFAGEIKSIDPDFSLAAYARNQPFRSTATLERLVDCLRTAGLPD